VCKVTGVHNGVGWSNLYIQDSRHIIPPAHPPIFTNLSILAMRSKHIFQSYDPVGIFRSFMQPCFVPSIKHELVK
jgi:hypothetical protein